MDSGDITQLRIDRCVEAHKPRDDTTLSGQYLSSSAATGRLVVVVVVEKRMDIENPTKVVTLVVRQKRCGYEIVGTTVTRWLAVNLKLY